MGSGRSGDMTTSKKKAGHQKNANSHIIREPPTSDCTIRLTPEQIEALKNIPKVQIAREILNEDNPNLKPRIHPGGFDKERDVFYLHTTLTEGTCEQNRWLRKFQRR